MANYNEMIKLQNVRIKNRILCPTCGHSVLFNRKDKVICRWCNHYVFKNKKVEFEYRIKEQLNKH